jgi:DNA-binding LacI/PurR family transcriptional regulator
VHETRSITLKDVAERAGVSKMAVSAVLRGNSGTVRVSEATRVRIIEAARELRYRPNGVAQALRRRSTNIIGFYSGYGYLDARNPFLSVVIGGLQEGCGRRRKDLLLHSPYHGASPDEVYGELSNGRIDGLVVTAAPRDPLIERLIESNLPTVAIVDRIPGLPSIISDETAGTRMLAEHLYSRGHRRIAYRDYTGWRVSINTRRAAFADACRGCGMQVEYWSDDELTPDPGPWLTTWLTRNRESRPTAVACWNDLAAYDLLKHCDSLRIRVPDDLAVTGYDGVPVAGLLRYRLTTVRAAIADSARAAVDLLVRAGEGVEPPETTVLPVDLVTGNTV